MSTATLEAVTADDFATIAGFVRRRSAIVLESGKEYLVESRLRPVALDHGLDGIGGLAAALRASDHGPLADRVVEAMTTNETSFFRDIHPFTALRENVLPRLMAERASTRRLRIWCGASSSGQEPYSLALTLLQHAPELADWDLKILCTDISDEMLERTRKGQYTQLEVNRGLPVTMLVKSFVQQGTEWQANEQLRRMLDVQPLNLVGPWPAHMGPFDLVFLRNVLIYFDVEDKRKVLDALTPRLAPGAPLFLGAAETTLGLSDAFVRRTHGSASWYEPKP